METASPPVASDLLASFGALRRLIGKSAMLASAALTRLLALMSVILRVTMRGFRLMRRMFVIARLEVLELLYALACRRHDASDGRGSVIRAEDEQRDRNREHESGQ